MKAFTLARAAVRGTTWLSTEGVRELTRRGRVWVLLLAAFGILIGLGIFLAFIVTSYSGLFSLGISSGHPELLFFYAVFASWILLFLSALPLALSLLYYSQDTRLLLTLPLRPRRIIAAKAAILYLSCLPVNLLLLAPALCIYALRFGLSAPVVSAGIIHLFFSPLFPLALAGMVVLVLMKLVNLSRYRLALEVAGMAVSVVLVIGIQVFISRTMSGALMHGTFDSLRSLPDFYSPLARALPPVAWAAEGFLHGGLWRDLLSLVTTSAASGAVLLLAPINFVSDVSQRGEAGGPRRFAGEADIGRMVRRRSVRRSLVRREWAVLASHSSFLFEAAAELLVLPLLLAVYGLVLPKELLGQALAFINASPLMGLILMGVLALMTNLTALSSTSISREGRLFSLSLTIPVSGREQLKAKLALHLMMFLPAYLLDLAIVFILFHLQPRMLLFLIPAGPIFQLFGFSSCIFFDLKRPHLKWAHPRQAMKQNLNGAAGMIGTAGLIAALAMPTAVLLIRGVDPFLVGCLMPIVPLALDVILIPRLFAFADRQYGGGLELEA